jgi:3-hydroxy acid dehydrogenase / malonic semialdehyde reductase
MKQWALVTGATSGIGQSVSELLAKNNYNLILTGRRNDRLKKLKLDLSEKYKLQIESLCFDVSNRNECEKIFSENKDILQKTTVLINNAGLARGVDSMEKGQLDDWDEMIDTNVKGLLYMTRLALPSLIENKPSHIINLGSVAGRWSYPGGGVYCATKFSVRAITEGLRMDLNGKEIRVTNISPGLVETEFSEVRLGDKQKAKKVYEGLDVLKPIDIAECILWTLQRPLHVNIQEMIIYPTAQASVTQVLRDPV